MDSYSEDLHLQNKGYVSDLSANDLSSLERDHEEAQPHFGVDEPLEVQLRFELGSLVDTHVLIDTDGPRESHWDFVRQEQGRFQASSEESNVLLSHGKQDGLKSFGNCESWPGSTSQVDTQLFIDSQDDVNMITEAFGGKDKSMTDLVEDDRGLLLPSTYRQCEEGTAWIGEDKEALEAKARKEEVVDETVEASKISRKILDARLAVERSPECRDGHERPVDEHEENHEAQHSPADVIKEPLLSTEQSCEVKAASLKPGNPQCIGLAVSSDGANRNQELRPDCSKRDSVESNQPDLSSMDDIEVSEKTETVEPTEKVNGPVGNAQGFCASEEKPKMDTVGSTVEAKVDDRKLPAMSDSVERESESDFVSEAKVDDRKLPAMSDSVERESDSDFVSRTSLPQETPELGTEPVLQTADLVVDTGVRLDSGKSFIAPGSSCPDNAPGGSCLVSESVLAEPVEKQNALNKQSTAVNSDIQGDQGISSETTTVSRSFQETTVLSILEASTTDENVTGKIPAYHGESKKLDERNDIVRETLDVKWKNSSNLSSVEPADNSLSAVTAIAAVPTEVHEECSKPASVVLERGNSYESGAGGMENNNSVNSLDGAEVMQRYSSAADLSVEGTGLSREDISRGQLPAAPETAQMSGGHHDLVAANTKTDPHEDAVGGALDSKHLDEPNNTLSNVDSSSKAILEKQVETDGACDYFKQEQRANDGNESIPQEQMLKQDTTEENAIDSSRSPAKPSISNESKVSTEVSHPGGILHVLLDVHKEGIADDSLLQNAPVQDHMKTIEGVGLADAQASNTSDIAGGAKVAEGQADTYVSGSIGQVVASGSQEDPYPSQGKSGKRKSDASTRNNRLKDSARASPVQVRSDQEQKNAVSEGLGRRKATPKSTAQKKGTEPVEGFASPRKASSKTSARKKVLSPMVQDAEGSPAVKEGSQTPASIGKTVFSGNARHHVSPDLNGLETASTMVSPSQPFSEPQQVQLRAQILVYGSLIQGAAPEEALMVAAFSNVTGGQVGRDIEASERAVWEKQWQAAVGRIHAKNSRDVPKDSSRANTALVPNSPMTAAKAAEVGSKPNGSSGLANSMADGRGTTGLPGKASEAAGTKGQARPKSTDSAHDVSVSSSQTTVAAASLGSITPMTLRSVSSSLNESFIQPVKPRADSQQMTPQAYFPTPPLGPFMTGAPQWFSTGSFPGSWMPQTQAAVYSNPPALFTHAQAAVSSDVAPETRRSTPSSSGTVMPVTSLGTTLFTPVVGGMSGIPTAIADTSHNKQPVSESRPRKRKKTHSESHGPSTDANPSYLTGTIPSVGSPATLTASHMQTGQANTVYLQPSAPEALALVVANTQLPKSSQERSLGAVNANKASVPGSTNMPSAGLPSVENFLEKSFNLQSSTNHLSQAQASAEEAASVAVSALRESESLWSQLKAQKTAGLIPEIKSQLVSSAIAVATAASVAKAAAAAAKAAYQAAVQAKKISEDVLDAGKQANESVPSRLLGDKVDITSQAWGMPESCNSILAAAKMASKQRFEAVSASRVRAENFESVVRAAELATNAITQVGSVMAMGESVPFSLDMLLEAGPEGLHRLEDQVKTKPKGTALRSPRRTGTPKSIEREKKFPLKITSGKEVASQRDVQLDNWTSESIMAARPENDARVNAELGVGLLTEFSKQKSTDQLALSVPASRQGLLTTRTEGGLMEQEVSVSDNKIVKGSLVEVMSDEKGLRGVWFSARVQSVDDEKGFVLYDDLLADDGYSPLEEWIQLKGSSGKGPRVRLAHPNTNIGFEGTRKRRREAMGSYKWSVGDRVDAWIRDGWWEGEIKEIIEDGESKAKVFFPEDGDTSIVKTSKLRPSLVWSNGHWVLWTDAKQGKKESPRARTDPHEGDTPLAKRQKTEKAQASGSLRQKLVPGSATEASAGHKEASLFDSSTVNLPPDFKGFTADSIAKSKPQGSKVVFGVPRPTKKRKLIEVSKHFGSAKGITGTSAYAKAANNKPEGASVYTPGSSDTSRLDASKTKKRVLHHPKARPQKDASSDVKVTGIRSKKEKCVVAAKTLVGKNSSNKEGLSSGSKNKDGKVMKKKNLPSDNDQVESQEQSEDTALPSNVVNLEAHTAPVTGEDIGQETALATHSKEKPNDAVRETGKEPFQPGQTDGFTGLPKVKEKQSFSQAKDSEIQSLAPASGNESASQSSKKKETQPSKDNEEAAHKGSESHRNHEGGKKLEVSSKKQPAKPINNVEKQPSHPIKEPEKSKEVGKPAEIWEPRRTSRKIQPTSKLLEGLQTAPKLGKTSSSHDRGNRGGSRAPPQP